MANTFELIASSTVGAGGASSIDFTSIPATYTDLLINFSGRSDRSAAGDWAYATFNSSTASFTGITLEGDGSAVSSYNTFGRILGMATGDTATANTFGNSYAYIPNYAGSTNKSFSVDMVTENNASSAFDDLHAGLWSNTAAITSISLTPRVGTKWLQYSTAYLYGIKNS